MIMINLHPLSDISLGITHLCHLPEDIKPTFKSPNCEAIEDNSGTKQKFSQGLGICHCEGRHSSIKSGVLVPEHHALMSKLLSLQLFASHCEAHQFGSSHQFVSIQVDIYEFS